MQHLTVTVAPGEGQFLVPMGMTTPHCGRTAFEVKGGGLQPAACSATGQTAAVVTPDGTATLLYTFDPSVTAPYPDEMFRPTVSRYTKSADSLIDSAQGLDTVQAVVDHVTQLFTYGHPDAKFYDGEETVPELCGMTEGSCVDINLYLIAMLRAAGFEAGYMTGYFFPEEKGGTCTDMHCWVVTRENGETQEWDIAHHLKMGTRQVRPGLNPKPGWRVPMAHSMGLSFPELGIEDLKLIASPMWLSKSGWAAAQMDIRCTQP